MRVIRDKKFRRLMKEAGLEKVELMKDYGYFWIFSDDDEWADRISMMFSNCILRNDFNHTTPEKWVKEIKELLEDPDNEY